VEVGYSLLEAHQKNGYATEAVRALIDRAFSFNDIHTVTAQTLPYLTPSIRVLERLGFQLVGAGSEEGAIRFALEKRSSAHPHDSRARGAPRGAGEALGPLLDQLGGVPRG
jgi:RimJ/RimL family protein N-acetyltransferase